MDKGTYAFVFVCQGGPIELKALYLAASLRKHLAVESELIAAIPLDYEAPSPRTMALLGEMGVRAVPIHNPLALDYPIGNKLACLTIETSAQKQIFLDSDILLMRRFDRQPRFDIAFNAKLADVQSYTGETSWLTAYEQVSPSTELANARAKWAPIYELFGLSAERAVPMPATVSGDFGLPYFNAGFIAVDTAAGLGPVWVDTCKRIDAQPAILDKRPWLDQLALPIAVARLGLDIDYLDDRYNFPALMRPMDQEPPYFCHYHWPRVIRWDPRLVELIEALDLEHPELGQMRSQAPDWAMIGRTGVPRRLPRSQPDPDLLITGLPRSGASDVASMLAAADDCVIFDEPPLVARALEQARPLRVFGYHRGRRSQLEDRAGGIATHELRWLADDEIAACTARVSRADFVLGSKNEMGYLTRLSAVRQVLPHARVVICVRNPLATIAEWKAHDPELASADTSQWRVGGSNDRWISGAYRHALEVVRALPTPAVRRAALWVALAERVLEGLALGAILVPYERLLEEPAEVLGAIVDGWGVELPPYPPVTPEVPGGLDADDVLAIRAICGALAARLGVWTDAQLLRGPTA